ncbi:unnamed protein product [Vicia faba]|uniref:Longin domain-containing protein n=1 Tax=Vicia faba TaxID=3906 RepID=A0AAV1A4I9_VICFA|nr:unnamed protein product [Vicia faba]
MAILYALVARGTVVLAEFSAVTGNTGAVARRLLEKLPTESDSRLCFSQDRYIFHILRSDGLAYLCMANDTFGISSSIKRFNCVAERCSSEVFLASVECLELIRLDTANYATALEAESNRGFIQLASEEHGKREKNKPVMLTGLMDNHWKACTDWVNPNGKPNLQFFSTHFGSSKVQIADCDTRDFTDQKREDMLVSDFVRLCFKYEGSAHFVKEYPDYVPYITPMFFCDDWLNLYLDNFRMNTYSDRDQQNKEICCSDYRFVYMGVKGSWTPLHADVFRAAPKALQIDEDGEKIR